MKVSIQWDTAVWKSLQKIVWNFVFVSFTFLSITKQSVTNFGVTQLLQFLFVWSANARRCCPLCKTPPRRFIGPADKNWCQFLQTPLRHMLQICKRFCDFMRESTYIHDMHMDCRAAYPDRTAQPSREVGISMKCEPNQGTRICHLVSVLAHAINDAEHE